MLCWNWLAELRYQMTRKTRSATRRRSSSSRNPYSGIEALEPRQLLTVSNVVKITAGLNGGPALSSNAEYGKAVTQIGDLNGDGTIDLAVSISNTSTTLDQKGGLFIQLMNPDGSVKTSTRISNNFNGGPVLLVSDAFGSSVAALGDVDGDGITDLAVGAPGDDTGGPSRGAVYIVFLKADGTAKGFKEIASGLNGGPALAGADLFGSSVTGLGDIDGDTIPDLAVGAASDSSPVSQGGAVYILRLSATGAAISSTKIASGVGGGPTLAPNDAFGQSVTSLGDVDGDGVGDLAVGALEDNPTSAKRGAAYVLFLNANGTVKTSTKIASGIHGGPTVADGDQFGASVAGIGDLDGDGVEDLAVGAPNDDTGGPNFGASYLLFLNQDGSVKSSKKIASGLNGGPILPSRIQFGSSLSKVADLNGDGFPELAVGAVADATSAVGQGALYVLFLDNKATNGNPLNIAPTISLNGGPVTFVKNKEAVAVVPNLTFADANAQAALQIPGGQLLITISVPTGKNQAGFDNLFIRDLSNAGIVGNFYTDGGKGHISVELSKTATLAQIEAALHTVTFTTEKKGLKATTRTMEFQVIDRAGAASSIVTQTINVRKKAPHP